MKRIPSIIIIATLLLAGNISFAQLRKVPSEVTDAFKVKYPNANAVEWKDKVNYFQASFEVKDEDYQAKFNKKGVWQETERIIKQGDLPAEVNEGFKKSKFGDWEVREVCHIEKKDAEERYRILVRKSDLEKKYLFFNKEGKLVKDSNTL